MAKNTSNIIIQVHVQMYFIDCMLIILPVKYINNMLLNMQITWQYLMLFKPPSYISTYLPSIDCLVNGSPC